VANVLERDHTLSERMSNWWLPLISSASALTGVWLGNILQRGREREERLALLRRDAFVDLYAWTLAASEARDASELPALSHEVLARLAIYIDPKIARDALEASERLQDALVAGDDRERRSAEHEAFRAIGRIQAAIEIRTKSLDSAKSARLRWRLRRVIRPPLSTDDPPWKELPIRDRLRRRFEELRRAPPTGPLDSDSVGPPL